MPRTIKWYLQNYTVSITMLTVFSVVVLTHGCLIRNALQRNTEAVDGVTAATQRQSAVNEAIGKVFQQVSDSLIQNMQQAEKNYEAIRESGRLIKSMKNDQNGAEQQK
jgi:hypothetical protein